VTYIIGLILVGVFFLAMRYFTTFNMGQQMSIATVILSILAVVVMYNEYTKQENQKLLDMILKYNQGKTIKCNGKDVNSTSYSLSIGTYTFIGKENTANFEEMISASDCE
jgi:hypothetical protein